MKVFVNRRPVSGPWGGGNRTIVGLLKELENLGHSYTFNLNESFDVIYCHDPRPDGTGLRYEHLLYFRENKKIPIFQRVGDVFYHRSENDSLYLKETIKHSDAVSFITKWAAECMETEIDNVKYFMHELRPPAEFFDKPLSEEKDSKNITLFTHHWSSNKLKGFNFYEQIDRLLLKEKYNNVEFVYLGRPNESFNVKKTKIVQPVDTPGVIKYLDDSDIYVTASKNETGGNHVVEALARGLPILYHTEGGGIKSICEGKGFEYSDINEFETLLDNLIENRQPKSIKIKNTLEQVCRDYIRVMEGLV